MSIATCSWCGVGQWESSSPSEYSPCCGESQVRKGCLPLMRPARNPFVSPMVGDVFEARGGRKAYEIVSCDGGTVRFSIKGLLGVLTLSVEAWIGLMAKAKCVRRGDGARL